MCGRFTLTADGETLVNEFGLSELAHWSPRYNIAPGQQVVALRATARAGPAVVLLKWGLIPFWSKDRAIGNRLINARAETAAEKPAFRSAFKRRRCLVLADGYFEWAVTSHGKQAYYMKPCKTFTVAALWEAWRSPAGDEIETCTLLTTNANQRLRAIHARMPVILPEQARQTWLDPRSSAELVAQYLMPAPDDALEPIPVSPLVNSPRNDVPACIEPF